ncbi:MAG: NAD-dependent epimerase/dehydratase family protein [Saprospiraceae bacterium]|nr:NAD-dependent epimerase/dehydratase family protein [Saprospiraceae bacterium]
MNTLPVIGLTGATGQIGSWILDGLVAAGFTNIHCLSRKDLAATETRPEVIWYQGDVTDPFTLEPFMESVQVLIHAAGLISYRNKDRRALEDVNVHGTGHVVNLALLTGVEHCIHISSSAVLGKDMSAGPIVETNPRIPAEPPRYYADSKYEGELEMWRGMEEGMGLSVLQPTIVLDPKGRGRSTQVFLQQASRSNLGYPSGGHGFVDVRDIVQAVLLLIQRGPSNERILLNGGNYAYRDVQSAIARSLEKSEPAVALSKTRARWVNRIGRWSGAGGLSDIEVDMAYETLAFNATRATESYGLTFTPLEETAMLLGQLCCCSE